MEDQTRTEDEIKKAEQYEALKRMLLRLLDDPQVEEKIVTLASLVRTTSKGISRPQARPNFMRVGEYSNAGNC